MLPNQPQETELRSTLHMTDDERTEVTHYAFKHALTIIGMSSPTTAIVFFAFAWCGDITTFKCFALFAGLTVFCNLAIMATWIPAAVAFDCGRPAVQCIRWPAWWSRAVRTWKLYSEALIDTCQERLLYSINTSVVCFNCVLAVCCLGYVLVIFCYPVWPMAANRQVVAFLPKHPFEVYEREFRERFPFTTNPAEGIVDADAKSAAQPNRSALGTNEVYHLRFVWGVSAVDNGSPFEPSEPGSLSLDNRFDAYTEDTQLWLRNFCSELRQQPFVHQSTADDADPIRLNSSCFIDSFVAYMNRSCTPLEPTSKGSLYPCCHLSPFPFRTADVELCLPEYLQTLQRTPGGPLLGLRSERQRRGRHRGPARLRAIAIDVDTTTALRANYDDVLRLHKRVNRWFAVQMRSAPWHMRSGFVHSDWQAFDLQSALCEDTIQGAGWAFAIAFVAMLLMTHGDLLVSGITCLTSSLVACSTVAVMVLLGWQHGVLESSAICMSIGLTVSVSLHYVHSVQVHRFACGPLNVRRRAMVAAALHQLWGPTAMAALATGLAGLCLLPAEALPYFQLGEIMTMMTAMSWMYHGTVLLKLPSMGMPRRHAFAITSLADGLLADLWLWAMRRQRAPPVGPRVAARREAAEDDDADAETTSLEMDMLEDRVGPAEDGLSPEFMVEVHFGRKPEAGCLCENDISVVVVDQQEG